jgi:hypothetical protein
MIGCIYTASQSASNGGGSAQVKVTFESFASIGGNARPRGERGLAKWRMPIPG